MKFGFNAKFYRLDPGYTRNRWDLTDYDGGSLGVVASGKGSNTGQDTDDSVFYNNAPPNDGGVGILIEVPEVMDITIPIEPTEVDVTTRASGGWVATALGMFKVSIDFEMLHDPTNANQIAFTAAHQLRHTVALALLDGATTMAARGIGVVGLWADWSVTKAEKSEGVDGIQRMKFTIKLGPSDVPPEVVTIIDES